MGPLEEGFVRAAESVVGRGHDSMILYVSQIILSVANQIISVTETESGRDGKGPIRDGKKSFPSGKDSRRHIDNHLWDGENCLADGLHSRCVEMIFLKSSGIAGETKIIIGEVPINPQG